MTKCPECEFTGDIKYFIHNTNPPAGNSGCWCPVCELSVEIVNGKVEHYIDGKSLNIAATILGKNINPLDLN